jgi:RNA polymerase sigma-70 factor (ECF subfamily)
MINSLPDAQRIVFNMFEVEGFSHLEIAELLDISEGNSRSRLFFAKQTLREKLCKIGINKYERYA